MNTAAKTPTRGRGAARSRSASRVRDADVEARELLWQMLRVRRFEEKCVELYSAAKIRGFMHLCIGEEAVAVGVVDALRPDDAVVATYREHGHALARGMPMSVILAEMFGKQTGCSRGRGGSMHLFDARLRFYGGNAIVGGGLPMSIGFALADKMRGVDRVTACIFGDGAFAEGEWHETANLAVLWHLPVVFFCENNRYAMGTAIAREHGNTDLATRAGSYGMVSWGVDGMDAATVRQAARRAVELVRDGGGPCFVELQTYRFRAHSMYDPDRYREKAEIGQWRERDPIAALTRQLQAAGTVTEEDLARFEAEIAAEIEDAIREADAAPEEPAADVTRFVYSEQGGKP
jgi:pyruvate dehydrogenase E1 component alpha subunit